MTNFTVYEGEGTVYQELETNPDIKVGDTIEFITNNQEGYEKYIVILGDTGEKSLELIDSYEHQMGYYDYNIFDNYLKQMGYDYNNNQYTQPTQEYRQPSEEYTQPTQLYTQPSQEYTQPTQLYTQPSEEYTQPTQLYTQENINNEDIEEMTAGKKRRTLKRSKPHKKIKTHKRKTHKRKTHKRKYHKH